MPDRPLPPGLDRERRQLVDIEPGEDVVSPPVDEIVQPTIDDRLVASVRTGRRELEAKLRQHPESGPELSGGDIDANWADAYAVGDEAPGGDNPTPDQDRVDDIGRALGVNYDDNEELRGSDKIKQRDRHRWELDPASADDWPHKP